jgi:hypothetical protein
VLLLARLADAMEGESVATVLDLLAANFAGLGASAGSDQPPAFVAGDVARYDPHCYLCWFASVGGRKGEIFRVFQDLEKSGFFMVWKVQGFSGFEEFIMKPQILSIVLFICTKEGRVRQWLIICVCSRRRWQLGVIFIAL